LAHAALDRSSFSIPFSRVNSWGGQTRSKIDMDDEGRTIADYAYACGGAPFPFAF
jgi:hypothetical protein